MHGHHASIVRASILYVQQRHNNAVIIHQLLPAIPSFHPFLSFSSIPSAQSHNLMTISPSHPSSCPIPYIVHHWLPSSHLVHSHPSFMITHRPVLLITVIHPSSHPVQSHHLPSSIILSSAISSFYPTPSIILSSPIPIIIHYSSMILSNTVHPVINCHRQDNVWETLPPIQGPYLLLHLKIKEEIHFPSCILEKGSNGDAKCPEQQRSKKICIKLIYCGKTANSNI